MNEKIQWVDQVDIETDEKLDESFGRFGEQMIFKFPNGYGASVICHQYSYGGPLGLFELAVIVWNGDDWNLTYETPITDDVIDCLEPEQVRDYLTQIKALPPAVQL